MDVFIFDTTVLSHARVRLVLWNVKRRYQWTVAYWLNSVHVSALTVVLIWKTVSITESSLFIMWTFSPLCVSDKARRIRANTEAERTNQRTNEQRIRFYSADCNCASVAAKLTWPSLLRRGHRTHCCSRFSSDPPQRGFLILFPVFAALVLKSCKIVVSSFAINNSVTPVRIFMKFRVREIHWSLWKYSNFG